MNPRARSVWIAPAASTAGDPSRTGQARTSSGPAVRHQLPPGRPHARAITRLQPASRKPTPPQNAAPPGDEGEIGQDELEIELLDVACRINRPRGRRKRWVVEGTHDMDERVRVPQAGEMLGRQLLRSDVALAGCGWGGQVDVGDVGV